MEKEKQQEHKNLLEILSLEEQAELIHIMNDFLGNLDLRLTDDPYFQFTCTIDQDGDLVLLPNDMKLTWIDLKQLFPIHSQQQLRALLEKHFQGRGDLLLKAIKTEIKALFDQSQRHNLLGHIVGNPDSFVFHDLPTKMRWQFLDLTRKKISSTLSGIGISLPQHTKSYQKDDYTILAHINHMLGPKRGEYFSMDKEHDNKLYLNRKGCIYLSKLYREVFQWLADSKGFFDLKLLYGDSAQYRLIQNLLKGKDMTDNQIISLVSCIDELVAKADPQQQDTMKAQFGTINDLVYAAHYAYHNNRFDFFELQLEPELARFSKDVTQSTTNIVEEDSIHVSNGGYVLFHEIAPLKDLVSAAIKSLRGKDKIYDIMRGRTVLNKEIFDRYDVSKKGQVVDITSKVFQGVDRSLQSLCTRLGMTNVRITRSLDNKYNAFNNKNVEEIGEKSFGKESFQLRKTSQKKIGFNNSNVENVSQNLSLEQKLVENLYVALSEGITGQLDGYEDMKTIFTISGYDRFGQPIEFGYEHMIVFSDYSNENPKSSHMMKLDPHKVVNGLTREAAVSSQHDFYTIHLAGVKSFIGMMKDWKQYLDEKKSSRERYQQKYPYQYIQDQFKSNNSCILDNGYTIAFSDINLDHTNDILLIHEYIAQSFREFMQQGKHHLFVRTKAKNGTRSNKQQLFESSEMISLYTQEKENSIPTGNILDLDKFLVGLDQKYLSLIEQTNGDMRRQLVTMTIPREGEIGVHIDGKIYWIAVSNASYLMRMLHPVVDKKIARDFATSRFVDK